MTTRMKREQYLKIARSTRKLPIQEVASKYGVGAQTVSNWRAQLKASEQEARAGSAAPDAAEASPAPTKSKGAGVKRVRAANGAAAKQAGGDTPAVEKAMASLLAALRDEARGQVVAQLSKGR